VCSAGSRDGFADDAGLVLHAGEAFVAAIGFEEVLLAVQSRQGSMVA